MKLMFAYHSRGRRLHFLLQTGTSSNRSDTRSKAHVYFQELFEIASFPLAYLQSRISESFPHRLIIQLKVQGAIDD